MPSVDESFLHGPHAGNLKKITHPGGSTEFTYDGLRRRVRIVEKNAGGATLSDHRYLWCGAEICQKRSGTTGGTVAKVYLPHGVVDGATPYYYTFDHLGSVREVVNTSGTVVARYQYEPFGKRTTVSGSYNADVGFAGYHYHAPSGLNLTLYRAYDPVQARWLSRDPIFEMGGLNLYGYVGGRPAELRDPLGLLTLPDSPSGLDPDIWEHVEAHKPPGGGTRYRAPNGDTLDFDPKKPDAPPGTWRSKDHWHWNKDHKDNPKSGKHCLPGAEVPDPEPICSDREREELRFDMTDADVASDDTSQVQPLVPFIFVPSPFFVAPTIYVSPPFLVPIPVL